MYGQDDILCGISKGISEIAHNNPMMTICQFNYCKQNSVNFIQIAIIFIQQ